MTIPEQIQKMFDEIALDLISRGIERYSSDAILHRIRWHRQIEQGDRSFKCNDNWTPTLARRFVEKHPQHARFFEFRKIKRRPDMQLIARA
jgi:hypothetical protein